MANLGLRRALAPHGIDVVETPVGDRNVLDALRASATSRSAVSSRAT